MTNIVLFNKIKSYFYYKLVYPYKIKRPNIFVKYNFRNNKLEIKIIHGFQSRNEATIILFLEAFALIKQNFNKNFSIKFYTGDYPIINQKCFSYSKSNEDDNIITIPNFDFAFWKEAGINDYQRQIDKIIEKSKLVFEVPKLFWIGNTQTNLTRQIFFSKFKNENIIECIHFDPSDKTTINNFVTLEDHCKYKYLIDLQGNGYSGRIKYLLFTGRPLIIQDRKFKTFYHSQLIPYEHYIPVKEDFSDLIAKINWLEENPEAAIEIGINAKNFAINNLQKESVINFYANQIMEYIKSY